MNWFARSWRRLRSLDPRVVDAVLAVVTLGVGILSVYTQDIRDADGRLDNGFHAATPWCLVTIALTCVPVAFRRRAPITALTVSAVAVFVHVAASWPEGSLPLTVILLTYTVGAWCPLRRALVGLGIVAAVIIVIGITDSPGIGAVDVVGILGQFAAAWAIGVAIRSRRETIAARLREADERLEAARQGAARVQAEERLRIAQELHDVMAHSMSVIAVQAGAGAHVLDDRPDQARAALEAISTTARGTLTELRRLLGVLRDVDGAVALAPAHGLADLPALVDDVRATGLPVELHVDGAGTAVHAGVELSAYRIVQEALTNVIKHAGAPTRVDVTVRHLPGRLSIEVVDDGRGLAAHPGRNGDTDTDAGHGLVGMRERVELWGGELATGAAPGGGYRVRALLPYEEAM